MTEFTPDVYGGDWTVSKLTVHQRYANAFTSALRAQPSADRRFRLRYVDGFAGSGDVKIKDGRYAGLVLKGSARIALEIKSRTFDELLLVDANPANVSALNDLVAARSATHVTTAIGDGNEELKKFADSMTESERAVVFIDPFATELEWPTVDAIVSTKKCDILIMFPVGAIRRLIPRRGQPPDTFASRLDRIFGGQSWRTLYHPPAHPVLSDAFSWLESDAGFSGIVDHYRQRLSQVGAAVLPLQFPLLRDQMKPGTQLFELIFAATNPAAEELATGIASDIMTRAKDNPEQLIDDAANLVIGEWNRSILTGEVSYETQGRLFE